MNEKKTTLINNGLQLTEYNDGLRFGTDALLLASFVSGGIKKKVLDIGSGSGVIGLLLLSYKKSCFVTGLEVQEKYALLAEENAAANGFSDMYSSVCGDMREYRDLLASGKTDIVVTNPPYMPADCGKRNVSDEKMIARHEVLCGINDVCECASFALRSGGLFYAVYRPERLTDLVCAMRASSIEPKMLVNVCPSPGEKPSLVMVKGIRNAKPGLTWEMFSMYTDKNHSVLTEQASRAVNEGEMITA